MLFYLFLYVGQCMMHATYAEAAALTDVPRTYHFSCGRPGPAEQLQFALHFRYMKCVSFPNVRCNKFTYTDTAASSKSSHQLLSARHSAYSAV